MNRSEHDPTARGDDAAIMHTDDTVAPGVSRRAASIIVAVGLFLAALGSAGLFVTLIQSVNANRHSTALTATQVQAIKELLAERKTQRDDEQAEVQRQLDAQARVLCTVLSDFLGGPSGPGHDVIAQAYHDLQCAALPKTPTRPTSSPTTTPKASSPSSHTAVSRPQPSSSSTSQPPQAGGAPPVTPPPASDARPPLGLPLLTPACGILPVLC